MQAVRPQFDQPNWNCRPVADLGEARFCASAIALGKII
jgi:hypothetical protein